MRYRPDRFTRSYVNMLMTSRIAFELLRNVSAKKIIVNVYV